MTDWLANGIAGAAVLISGAAYLSGRASAASSKSDAARAADAANKSAGAALRAAEALEAQVDLGHAEAARYEVPWALERAGGDMWRLINTNGTETAFDVTADPVDPKVGPLYLAPQHAIIGPRGAVEFFGITPDSDHHDTRIRVVWRRSADGELQEPWVHPTG